MQRLFTFRRLALRRCRRCRPLYSFRLVTFWPKSKEQATAGRLAHRFSEVRLRQLWMICFQLLCNSQIAAIDPQFGPPFHTLSPHTEKLVFFLFPRARSFWAG